MTDDFYCEFVLSNKIAVQKLHETDEVLAFYHTKPQYKVHVVVIPKDHIRQLIDVENYSVISKIFEVIAETVRKLGLQSFRIITNSGSYQDSKHLHFHLISDQ